MYQREKERERETFIDNQESVLLIGPKLSPLLRACSSSAALRAAELHTHVRTHRTSSDPAYLHTYVHCTDMKREEDSFYFRNPGLKRTRGFSGNGPSKNRDPGIRV